ncbi:MAG: hypothetical protein MUF42_02340 [Cytophagaceae bacterium]|jgi:hypothetical protein|nr:hypothetical protein [Cytophagaceae bacterium]
MALTICITWDYELYFGSETGTVEACMLAPTRRIGALAAAAGASMTFFIDMSFLLCLRQQMDSFPALKESYHAIEAQLQQLIAEGHRCELHLHPHWIDCRYDGQRWQMNTQRYRLHDLEPDERYQHILDASKLLTSITGVAPRLFRAGGYCAQPFADLITGLKDAGICTDSSVFAGGKSPVGLPHCYDYENAPVLEKYRFENDLIAVNPEGSFGEIPISARFYSPWFFARVYALGRLFPSRHKSVAAGAALGAKGFRKMQLTKGGTFPLSTDGYYSSVLNSEINKAVAANKNLLVTLGHPKAMSEFSFRQLQKILQRKDARFSSLPFFSGTEFLP